MWRWVAAALSAWVIGVSAQPSTSITFAWDLDPSHAEATFEAEIDGAIVPCVPLAVLETERRCGPIAIASGVPHTFRLRGVIAEGAGAWSDSTSTGGLPPGTFTITATISPIIPGPVPEPSEMAADYLTSLAPIDGFLTSAGGVVSDTFDAGTAADRVLLVWVTWRDRGQAAPSVTYNGVSLTAIGADQASGQVRAQLYGLAGPASGANTLSATFGAAGGSFAVLVDPWVGQGVDSSSPWDGFAADIGNGDTSAVTVSSATDDRVVVFHHNASGGFMSTDTPSGYTERQDGFHPGSGHGNAWGDALGAVSVATSALWNASGDWIAVGINLNAAGGGGGTLFEQDLAGSVAPAGALTRQASQAATGSVAPAAVLRSSAAKPVSGALTPAGALTSVKASLLTLLGLVAPSGAPARDTSQHQAGAIVPSGAVQQTTGKPVAGTVVPASVLTSIKVALQTFTGSIASAGTVTRQGRLTRSGAVAPAAARTQTTTKQLAGAVTPAGSTSAVKVALLALVGSLEPAGVFLRELRQQLAGTIAPTSAHARLVTRLVSGTLGLAGAVTNVLPNYAISILRVASDTLRRARPTSETLRQAGAEEEALRRARAINEGLEPW